MIKKGDDEIIALYKGNTEVYRLYNNGQLLYDADKVEIFHDDEEDDSLIIYTDRCAKMDEEDEDCLVLISKPWNKVSLENK